MKLGNWKKFKEGFALVSEVVGVTYGAWGHNVSVIGGADRVSFDDGLKVITAMRPDTPEEIEAVLRARDVARAQHSDVGDGTSTATLLFASFMEQGIAELEAGTPNHLVANDLESFCNDMCTELENQAVTDIGEDGMCSVATIAMHGNRELGEIVGKLAYSVGDGGVVVAEKSTTGKFYSEKSHGYMWKGSGATDKAFVTKGRGKWENPYIIVCGNNMESVKDQFFQSVVEVWATFGEKDPMGRINPLNGQVLPRPLVFIVASSSGPFQSTGVENADKGIAIISAPKNGNVIDIDRLRDIAAMTGATYFADVNGKLPGRVSINDFGRAKVIAAELDSCSIVPTSDVDLGSITETIKEEYAGVTTSPEYINRVTSLNGTSGIIYIPVRSETEFSEIKEQVEDGFQASMEAWKGVIPGGLFPLVRNLSNEYDNWLQTAVGNVFKIQWHNAGLYDTALDVLMNSSENVLTTSRDEYQHGESVNPFEAGVIDPVSVVVSAIQKAASVAVPLLRTKVLLLSD